MEYERIWEVVTISGKPGRWLKLAPTASTLQSSSPRCQTTLRWSSISFRRRRSRMDALQTVLAELPSPTGNSELLQWTGASNYFQFVADPEAGSEGWVQVILGRPGLNSGQ